MMPGGGGGGAGREIECLNFKKAINKEKLSYISLKFTSKNNGRHPLYSATNENNLIVSEAWS